MGYVLICSLFIDHWFKIDLNCIFIMLNSESEHPEDRCTSVPIPLLKNYCQLDL